MSPTIRRFGAMLLGLNLVGLVDAQSNVTVEESDPALVFTPFVTAWNRGANPQKRADGTVDGNYFHGGGYVVLGLPGATVSLTFNGSYIAYYSDLNNNHGSMSVTLDSKATTLSTYNAAGGVPQIKLFESIVNPDIPNHTITLTCLDGRNMGLDYFLYTAANPTVSSSGTPPTTSYGPSSKTSASLTTTSSEQGAVSTSSSPSRVTIVAAVLAAIGWAVAFVFTFLFLRLRRGTTRRVDVPGSQYRQNSMPISPSLPVAIAPPTFPELYSSLCNDPAAMRGFSLSISGPKLGESPVIVAASSMRTLLQSPPAYSSEDR